MTLNAQKKISILHNISRGKKTSIKKKIIKIGPLGEAGRFDIAFFDQILLIYMIYVYMETSRVKFNS